MSGTIGIGTTGVQLAAIGQYMQQTGPYPLNNTRQYQQTIYIRGDADPATQGQQRRMSSFQQKNLRFYQCANGTTTTIDAPSAYYVHVMCQGDIVGLGGNQYGGPGGPVFKYQTQTGVNSYISYQPGFAGALVVGGSGGGGMGGGGAGGFNQPAQPGGNGAPAIQVQGGGSIIYQGSHGNLVGGAAGGGGGGYSQPITQSRGGGGGGGAVSGAGAASVGNGAQGGSPGPGSYFIGGAGGSGNPQGVPGGSGGACWFPSNPGTNGAQAGAQGQFPGAPAGQWATQVLQGSYSPG